MNRRVSRVHKRLDCRIIEGAFHVGPELIGDAAGIKALIASVKNVVELLFDYTRKALHEFEIAQAEADSCKEQLDAWKYQAEREIKRQRFCALWDVIEAAKLEEEYEKWTRRPAGIPF